MKYILPILFFSTGYLNLAAQSNCPKYTNAIQQGKAFLNKRTPNFDKALIEFQAAQIAARECGLEERAGKVAAIEIKKVFEGLRQQRDKAIRNEKRAKTAEQQATEALAKVTAAEANLKKALYETEQAKNEAQVALQRAEKLINAFYFYDGKLALAFQRNKYGFINKEGDAVIKYQFEKAEQFDDTGFAKVQKGGSDFLLDSTGLIYPVAYQIADLTEKIEALDLRGIHLDGFPMEILNHPQLKIVILNGTHRNKNSIHDFPQSFQALQSLEYLSLKYCEINEFPTAITQLRHLKKLIFTNNQFSRLPAEIGQLIALQVLDLKANQLTNLVPEIGQMNSLQYLNISNNRLTSLPPEVGQLNNLQYLDLSFNQLTNLSPEIGQLSQLKKLELNGNRLVSLPTEIGQVRHLQYLDLYDNQLSSLVPEIGQLQALEFLKLQHNRLENLPATIGQLKALQYLDVSINQLNSLPPEFGQLKSLESLNLGFNRLTNLPLQFGQLTNLHTLGLDFNQLKTLPKEIGLFSNLKNFDLQENPLTSIPDNIFDLELDDNDWTQILDVLIKNGNYKQAIEATQKSLEVVSNKPVFYSQLALAYLLNNQYSEAEKIYLRWKGKTYQLYNQEKQFTVTFLKDIKELEKRDIHHPDFQKAKQILHQ